VTDMEVITVGIIIAVPVAIGLIAFDAWWSKR